MSLSVILEVMIGVSFVYLLLSLVLTAITEAFASLLNRRGRNLKLGVMQLLQNDADWTKKFYDHPFIMALRQPAYLPRNRDNPAGPSYIPKATFAKTMIDLLARTKTEDGKDARDEGKIIDNIDRLPDNLKVALRALHQIAGADLTKFQEALETWFDDSMERVSGWYKRMTNAVLLGLAVPLVILANADSIVLVKALWTTPTTRENLVARAQAFVKNPPKELQHLAEGKDETDKGPPDQTPDVQPDIDESLLKVREAYGSFEEVSSALSLPLGWKQLEADSARAANLEEFAWEWGLFGRHFIGWLISVFALSMGAPFWFETLNRLISIRGAGRKPDTPEEEKKKEEKKQAAAAKEKTPGKPS